MKIGSLFDGSGGFPFAAALCGIEPVWASEVEPYPIAVTKTHLPKMKHLGSVTDIDGGKVEPVNIITFGSPCQDLSVAGKRAGLKHEANGDDETTRSGLFMEAVRIIKEMREATDGRCPNVAVWENVPGAFSSNHGEDFRTVLEELIKIVEPTAVMPAVPKGGWAYADCYIGDGWSLAYRVLDAQYIRTAQRRRRIFLVLHLTGKRAGEILFERESLRRHSPQSGTPRKAATRNAEDGTGADDSERSFSSGVVYDTRGNGDGEVVPTITGDHENRVTDYTAVAVEPVFCLQGNGIDRADTAGCNGRGWNDETCYTLNTIDRPAVAYSMSSKQQSLAVSQDISNTLGANDYKEPQAVAYTLKIRSGCEGGGKGALIQENLSATLSTNNDQYLFQAIPYRQGGFADYVENEVGTIKASGGDLGGGQ